MDMYEIVRQHRILAILRNIPLDITLDYCRSAIEGGIRFFEVALNSQDAYQQINLIREALGDQCLVGAGTAITAEKAKKSVKAGAQFLLTPGTPRDVLEFCVQKDIYLLPGVLTPSEVASAMEYGFKTFKLFPAGSMPINYIKSCIHYHLYLKILIFFFLITAFLVLKIFFL